MPKQLVRSFFGIQKTCHQADWLLFCLTTITKTNSKHNENNFLDANPKIRQPKINSSFLHTQSTFMELLFIHFFCKKFFFIYFYIKFLAHKLDQLLSFKAS